MAAAAGLGAALSHTSSAVILVAVTGLIAVVHLARGRLHRARVVDALAVAVLVTGLAWGLYYRHFTPTYRAIFDRPATIDAPVQPPPVMRAEAHQTRFIPGRAAMAVRAAAVPRYLVRYYGVPGLALGAVGLLLLLGRWREDSLAATCSAWAIAVVAFMTLGVLSPLDLRYYLAGYPLVALSGGFAAAAAFDRGGWARRLAIAALALTGLVAARAWWIWLRTPDF